MNETFFSSFLSHSPDPMHHQKSHASRHPQRCFCSVCTKNWIFFFPHHRQFKHRNPSDSDACMNILYFTSGSAFESRIFRSRSMPLDLCCFFRLYFVTKGFREIPESNVQPSGKGCNLQSLILVNPTYECTILFVAAAAGKRTRNKDS